MHTWDWQDTQRQDSAERKGMWRALQTEIFVETTSKSTSVWYCDVCLILSFQSRSTCTALTLYLVFFRNLLKPKVVNLINPFTTDFSWFFFSCLCLNFCLLIFKFLVVCYVVCPQKEVFQSVVLFLKQYLKKKQKVTWGSQCHQRRFPILVLSDKISKIPIWQDFQRFFILLQYWLLFSFLPPFLVHL